jgi:hypothetical protein
MGCSTRRAAALVLGLGSSGCVTGHLFDAARRWEQPAVFEAASLDGDRLVLRYRARVTDDDGDPIGDRQRRVAVAIASLRAADAPTAPPRIDDLPDRGPLAGRPLPLVGEGDATALPRIEVSEPSDGGPACLVLYAEQGRFAPLYANAFTRSSTAAWAYPLVPVTAAVDAVAVPVLLFLAPAVLTTGD